MFTRSPSVDSVNTRACEPLRRGDHRIEDLQYPGTHKGAGLLPVSALYAGQHPVAAIDRRANVSARVASALLDPSPSVLPRAAMTAPSLRRLRSAVCRSPTRPPLGQLPSLSPQTMPRRGACVGAQSFLRFLVLGEIARAARALGRTATQLRRRRLLLRRQWRSRRRG